jgi:antitoxin ParD1/3/4
MITALRKKVTVRADGRIEIKSKDLIPGTKAEVIVLIEGTDVESQKRVRQLKALFKDTQALPQAKTITEEEIAAEIEAYRAGD